MKKLLPICFIIFSIINIMACKTPPKKEDPNFLGDFDGTEIARLMAGIVTRIKGERKPAEIEFYFYPRTNILVFHFRNKSTFDNVWVSLNQENREVLSNGINRFLDAYKNQTLAAKDNKKKALFGKTRVNMSWGLLGAAREAKPTLRCEYQLLTENRPYFILGNATAESKNGANCPALRMAFSPAQCEDFLQILSQENLLKIVEEQKKEFNKYDTKDGDAPSKENPDKAIKYGSESE